MPSCVCAHARTQVCIYWHNLRRMHDGQCQFLACYCWFYMGQISSSKFSWMLFVKKIHANAVHCSLSQWKWIQSMMQEWFKTFQPSRHLKGRVASMTWNAVTSILSRHFVLSRHEGMSFCFVATVEEPTELSRWGGRGLLVWMIAYSCSEAWRALHACD